MPAGGCYSCFSASCCFADVSKLRYIVCLDEEAKETAETLKQDILAATGRELSIVFETTRKTDKHAIVLSIQEEELLPEEYTLQIASFPENLLKHLTFKFSYHYLEHHRLGLTERFFNNIKMMKNAGCSFTLEITPNDELVEYIPQIKEEAQHFLGALCHVTIVRNDTIPSIPILIKLPEKEFYKTWEQFDSSLLTFKKEIFGKHLGHFCYAGDWSVYVHLGTGDMTQCYRGKYLDNIYKNVKKPLHFEAVGHRCTTPQQEGSRRRSVAWGRGGRFPFGQIEGLQQRVFGFEEVDD